MRLCKNLATLAVIAVILTFVAAVVAGYTLYYEIREMVLT